MFKFGKRKNDRAKQLLQKQVADLQAQLEAKDRIIAILEAERDTLGAVIARDRARIQAETACHVRQRAECEQHESTLSR